MAYPGKALDRSPIICPAGKVWDHNETVAHCLRTFPLVDQIDAVKHEQGINDKPKEEFPYAARRSKNALHPGIYCESHSLFYPPITRRYETLIRDIKETTYRSYWDKELGRTRDMIGDLPSEMDPETTLFGKPSTKEYGVKELVNPPKSPAEVLWESQEGHEMYRKSHNDYNIGERINRGYLQPAFDPNRRYGMTTIFDPKGIWVKCACTWHLSGPVTFASSIQADVSEKTKSKLGKCLTPNNNKDRRPLGFRFGKPSKRAMCGVWELLRDPDCEPCLFRRDFLDWIEHLNQLRNYIKRRRGKFIDLHELRDSFKYYDKDWTGWIPAETLHEICKCKNLNFEREKLNALACILGILQGDKMQYNRFIELIDINTPCPELIKIPEISAKNNYFITTNMDALCDFLTIDNSNSRAAGIPTVRNDFSRPTVRPGDCKSDIDSLGDETSVRCIISPSIFTNYGLSHRDFFLPRQPKYLRTLFEAVGYQFPDDAFDKLWKIGVDLDKTGSVCVDTFKKLLRDSVPQPAFPKSEETKC